MNFWITGDCQHSDFADLEFPSGLVPHYIPWESVLESSGSPDVLVLAQARRRQFAATDAARCRDRWSTIPCIHLLSSWCEGEMRSGSPLAGWIRVYWHRWRDECARFVNDRIAGRSTSWDALSGAPLQRIEQPQWPGGRCLRIGIWSRQRSETLMVQQCLQWFGHSPIEMAIGGYAGDSRGPLDASVIVGDSFDPWVHECMRTARRINRRGLKIVMLGYPRREEVQQLTSLGGKYVRVVSKPFDVGLLQQTLQSLDS